MKSFLTAAVLLTLSQLGYSQHCNTHTNQGRYFYNGAWHNTPYVATNHGNSTYSSSYNHSGYIVPPTFIAQYIPLQSGPLLYGSHYSNGYGHSTPINTVTVTPVPGGNLFSYLDGRQVFVATYTPQAQVNYPQTQTVVNHVSATQAIMQPSNVQVVPNQPQVAPTATEQLPPGYVRIPDNIKLEVAPTVKP